LIRQARAGITGAGFSQMSAQIYCFLPPQDSGSKAI
jgi:hypothetical protein